MDAMQDLVTKKYFNAELDQRFAKVDQRFARLEAKTETAFAHLAIPRTPLPTIFPVF